MRIGPEPDHSTFFVQAVQDDIKKGILDEQGSPIPILFHIYVNNNLIAEIKSIMLQAISAKKASFFMSTPEPKKGI